jgi:indolepyruvate ferredoxin oxidoreductase
VQHWADAQAIVEDLLGSATTANVFVIGMAVQAGCLPVTPAHVEAAIGLNGVAVEVNLAAFRWGRAQVARPDAVEAARAARAPHPERVARPLPDRAAARIAALAAPAPLDAALRRYATELEAWQGPATIGGWLDVVERAARAEHAADPASWALTGAVVAEYEVARLMTDDDGNAAARAVAGDRGAVAWRLHPPILRAMGLDHKISIPTWATPGVRALARAKGLRGTLADPFRWAEVRRVERRLAKEYVAAIDEVLAALGRGGVAIADAVRIAELPDIVRGYEHIKLANVERYRAALAEELAALR